MSAATALDAAALAGLPPGAAPTYDRRALTPGVLHVGLGAFGRAHVAHYCEDLLSAGDADAAVVGASLRTGAITAALGPQDGLYTLIESAGGEPSLRVIGAVAALAHGSEVADHVAAPATTVVTVTVTEKGYCRDPRTGGLDLDHPDVVSDLAPDRDPSRAPRSLPGALVDGLQRRRRAGGADLAVISCDNLPANGEVTRAVVTDLARRRDEDLATWIDEHVTFRSTVVDRIVPAATDEDRELVRSRLGVVDRAPVRAEAHRLWVIEAPAPDGGVGGMPAWDRVGAVFTDDLAPFQDRKLRLVNALHSAAAYLGLAAGFDTIAQAVADADLRAWLDRLGVEEIEPTLPAVGHSGSGDPAGPAPAPGAATAEVLDRFANASLRHRCAQVGADGSQKLGPRILATAAIRLDRGDPVVGLATVVAAWSAHVGAALGRGAALEDPLSGPLSVALERPAEADRVRALLEVITAPDALLDDDRFVAAVVAARRERGWA